MSAPTRRIVCLVADGFGIGAAPDAAKYGDEGSNTLGNLAQAVGGVRLSNLERLGLGNLGKFRGLSAAASPLARVTRLAERSEGKDTTTGHWELAGLVTRKPFATFPKGFPDALIQAFIREAQVPGILANRAASGTQILEELGEEHIRTLKPIVYTSADSVFQIAAHEKAFGLERLHQVCAIARKLTEPYQIGRVIARPFVGTSASDFRRTENRRDYSVAPGKNTLDLLLRGGVDVLSVGKIEDIFDHRGITRGNHTGNNADSLRATYDFLTESRGRNAFIFTNLVDFDMLYGHRRDAAGYARSLHELDDYLPKLLGELRSGDILMLTADHGCDPTFHGTDHTREYVPLVAFSPGKPGGLLPDRGSFADVGATILKAYGIDGAELGEAGHPILWETVEA
jgi:phosphopentomutase